MYVYIYICMYTCVYIHIYIYIFTYIYTYRHMRAYVYTYIYCLYIYIHIHVNACVFKYIYIYSVCLYIYIHTHVSMFLSCTFLWQACVFASYLHESFIPRFRSAAWEDTFGPLSRTWDVFWALVLSPVWDEVPRNSMGMNLFNRKTCWNIDQWMNVVLEKRPQIHHPFAWFPVQVLPAPSALTNNG